jgi:ferredoxin
VKVHVDFGLCESNGVCMGVAPDVFLLNDDDTLSILQPDVEPENEDAVLDAVRQCPRQAISVEE